MGWHVTVKVALENPSPLRLTLAGYCGSLAVLLIVFGWVTLRTAAADSETRTISLHHIHTNEDLTVTYKVNGRYDETALTKINNLLRDWRQDKPTAMDPHLIDLLWEVHREVGAKEPIWIVCGYRSPSTNDMLRKRSSGVAKFSQHMLGKAIDFYIPGVPLDQLRAAGLRAQHGGVGFYPTSGSPFVHLDTGGVRHWPRLPEVQLAGILSKGPLASRSASDPRGTAFAQGDIVRPDRKPGFLAKLLSSDNETDEEADAAAAAGAPSAPADDASARIGKVEPKLAEKASEKWIENPAMTARAQMAAIPLPPSRPVKPETYQIASADSKPVAKPGPGKDIDVVASKSVSAPTGYQMASASEKPVRLAQAENLDRTNSGANDVLSTRGYWRGLPSAEPVEVPATTNSRVPQASTPATQHAAGSANAGPKTTAGITKWPLADGSDSEPLPNALSYASQPTPIAVARTVPMGTTKPRAAPAAREDTTIVVKHGDDRLPAMAPQNDGQRSAIPSRKPSGGAVRVGDRFNDPWMRAMILSPSAQSFMGTTLFGLPDFRNLGPYMQKPVTALAMTFGDDPNPGMTSEQFAGSALTFIGSVKFGAPSAAAR